MNPPREGHLYPNLSDIETTTESERDCTTATVSESESDRLVSGGTNKQMQKDDYDGEDRWERFVDTVTDFFLFFLCLE